MHKNSEDILVKTKINGMRQLLREFISRGDLVDAINNREIVKILYDGEDTQRVGWRTVEPYVLGTSKAGNIVLRGWQQAGASDGFNGIGRTPRQNHERWQDYHGVKGQVPGWRLFRLDGIKQIMFTNTYLDVERTPPEYKPNEPKGEITGIIASVTPAKGGKQTIKGIGDVEDDREENISVFDPQTNKWKILPKDKSTEKLMMQNYIRNFVNYVSRKQKEALSDWMVVNVDNRIFPVRDNPKNQSQYRNDIVGNLKELYHQYFAPSEKDRSMLLRSKQEFERERQKALEKAPEF